jgi:hypothetical protein
VEGVISDGHSYSNNWLSLWNLGVASLRVLVFLRRFSSTQLAFANFSPGLECSDNPGKGTVNAFSTLKVFANLPTLSALLIPFNAVIPGLSLRSNPGLTLANAFGVNGQTLGCGSAALCSQ